MCFAQDRRLKSIKKAATLHRAQGKPRQVERIFKKKTKRVTNRSGGLLSPKEAATNPKASSETTSNLKAPPRSKAPPLPPLPTNESGALQSAVKLDPRPSPFRLLASTCAGVSYAPLEDLRTLRRSKSFDEEQSDIALPVQSVANAKVLPNDSRKDHVPIDFDFLRDVPAGGLLSLPRRRQSKHSHADSHHRSGSDLTAHMSNLTMQPEPLILQEETSRFATPTGSPNYPNLKTPPTPHHFMKICQQHSNLEIPTHLFMPTFFE